MPASRIIKLHCTSCKKVTSHTWKDIYASCKTCGARRRQKRMTPPTGLQDPECSECGRLMCQHTQTGCQKSMALLDGLPELCLCPVGVCWTQTPTLPPGDLAKPGGTPPGRSSTH